MTHPASKLRIAPHAISRSSCQLKFAACNTYIIINLSVEFVYYTFQISAKQASQFGVQHGLHHRGYRQRLQVRAIGIPQSRQIRLKATTTRLGNPSRSRHSGPHGTYNPPSQKPKGVRLISPIRLRLPPRRRHLCSR